MNEIFGIGQDQINKYGSIARLVKVVDMEHVLVKFFDIPLGQSVEAIISKSQFISEKFRSPFDRSIKGWGYIGAGKYSRKEHGKCYESWVNRIRHVMDQNTTNKKSYLGTGISDDFLCFQNYAAWWYSQKGHEQPDFQVDKDLLAKGYAKEYSAENCCIIPGIINKALRRKDGPVKFKRLSELANKFRDHIEPRVYEALVNYEKMKTIK